MNYLIYGIVRQNQTACSPEPGIRYLAAHRLAIAASAVEDVNAPPSVTSLLAYERVVEAIHASQTIIPMRYGCLVESESAAFRLLEEHCQEYEALLARLRGLTEMGIRILWPACARALPDLPSSLGAAYLASLRDRYHCASALAPEEAQLADRITDLLSGRFVERRREASSSSQGRLVSLYFLTPKTFSAEFRSKIHQVHTPGGAKLLISGPWPPYNFVTSVD